MLFQFDIPHNPGSSFSPQVLLPLASPGYPGLHGSNPRPLFEVPPGVLGLSGQTWGLNLLFTRPQHGLGAGGGGHIFHIGLLKRRGDHLVGSGL